MLGRDPPEGPAKADIGPRLTEEMIQARLKLTVSPLPGRLQAEEFASTLEQLPEVVECSLTRFEDSAAAFQVVAISSSEFVRALLRSHRFKPVKLHLVLDKSERVLDE